MQYSIKILIFLFSINFSLLTINSEGQTTQLWGMTSKGGGPDSCGVIFRIFSDGTGFQDMYVFTKITGCYPHGNLINVNGELFGMTDSGGTKNGGVIFRFDPVFNYYSVLYNFDTVKYNLDTLSGKWPSGSLTYIGNNMLYGMANSGGSAKKGVIFSFNISTNQYSVVHHFQGLDGQFPSGSLFYATNPNYPASVGNFYGMTPLGGADSLGVVFSFNPSTNVFTTMLNFTGTGTASGANPRGSPIQADNGNLYGMTYGGGDSSRGVIYTLNPLNNSYGLIFTFHGINGAFPYNSLFEANNSKLYGFNISNANGFNTGSLFWQNLTGLHTDVLDFGTTDYGRSYSNVIQAQNGLLYSMTYVCGHDTVNAAPDSAGVIFSININNNAKSVIHVFNTQDGANPFGDLLEMPVNTGIQNIPNNTFTATVYPNPVNDIATFMINLGNETSYSLKVYNFLGQENSCIMGNNKIIEVAMKGLPAGMYFYQIIPSNSNNISTGKFIKE